ncbi:MAG: DUF4360 domain-containing protein [Bdellovibrionaceae bacterium]|nr:DUF4360 domain-containing protein [Bdellovibrionales bacterium]MCB9083684.1 DUF4360 domain-containing protein [Pseudobdellovibrionaceae bacterium]
MSIKSLVLALTVAFSSAAIADGIRLGENVGYGGNGCPAGSASITLSPDASTLSILFDQYMAEAAPRKFARKSCNISVPVHVPQGYSVSLMKIDYRGFNMLPRGAYSDFNVEYFFAGQRGPKMTRRFRGEQAEEYLIQDGLVASAMVWSACGADVNLRVNSSIMVNNTRNRSEDALMTVDSVDIKSGIVYHLAWRTCR